MTTPPLRLTATATERVSGIMTPSVIAVVFEPGPQRVLARVCGEIDLEDADELLRDLIAALDSGTCGLDLDLSGVTFCDCSGLRILLHLNRLAQRAGKTLVLTTLSPRVARLLQLTGTHQVFTVRTRSTPDEASPGAPMPREQPMPGRPDRPSHQGIRR